ncbi:PHP domain-containing protein [Candidatus Obscuribacterales bacterium]|nr:PHP domain-containing protein [Candidatus Obscuribacterales bacterium]
MKIDLHLHTTHSDGNWSPTELVAHAIKLKMDVIAITDHDTVSGIDEGVLAAGNKLEIIPAVEINTIWIDEDGSGQDIHILGYFIDKTNAKLSELLQRQRAARLQQVERLVAILNEEGIPISMALVRSFAKGGPIGKVHVTNAIVAAGGAPDVSAAYARFYDRNSKYFVARQSVTPIEAIDAIRAAGGLTSIAHPGMSSAQDHSDLIKQLTLCGLNGIEAYHSAHSDESVSKLLALADRLNLLVTGGSDCHGPFEEYESLMGTVAVPSDVVARLKLAHADFAPAST